MTRSAPRTLLSLALLAGNAPAQENWQHLGDYYARPIRAMGASSLNFDTLRRREHHFEVWERLTPLRDSYAVPAAAQPRPQAQLTLWAVRCRSGVMAKITEGASGAFEPRTDNPRFFLPAPASSGAAVIAATCAEIRRRAQENRTPPVATGPTDATPGLDRPPAILEDEALESEHE